MKISQRARKNYYKKIEKFWFHFLQGWAWSLYSLYFSSFCCLTCLEFWAGYMSYFKGGHQCKVNEKSPIPVDFPRLCGNNIIDVYKHICDSMWARRRRRRGKLMTVFYYLFWSHIGEIQSPSILPQSLRSFHWNRTYTEHFLKLCQLINYIIGT